MNLRKAIKHEKALEEHEKAISQEEILYWNRAFIKDKKLKPGDLYCVEYYLTPDHLRCEIAVYIKGCTFALYTESCYIQHISFDSKYKLLNIFRFEKQPYDFINIQIDPKAKN